MEIFRRALWTAAALVGLVALAAAPAAADQVINDDCIVIGSQCIGFDCVNGESFGFDTLRLKENNLRIHFWDTSNSASFPTADWRIVANDSTNGGSRYLAFEDTDAGRQTFRVFQGARANALVVSGNSRVGLGTATPAVELHIVDGDTPTLRLEQNGSSGFQPQTWDLAGNETNFFIRDVTNASRLPFRIRPGAPTSSIDVAGDGKIGIGRANPVREVHIQGSDGPRIQFTDTEPNPDSEWVFGLTGNQNFFINDLVRAGTEFQVNVGTGQVTIDGDLVVNGTCTGCDEVFQPGYPIETIEEHAELMWTNSYLPGVGPSPVDEPIRVFQKTAGILNELEKAHIYIEQLHSRLVKLEAALAAQQKTK